MGTKFTFASIQTTFVYLERSLSKMKKCEFCCNHPHPPLYTHTTAKQFQITRDECQATEGSEMCDTGL